MATPRTKTLCPECDILVWPQNKAKHKSTQKHKYNNWKYSERFSVDGQHIYDINQLVRIHKSVQTENIENEQISLLPK